MKFILLATLIPLMAVGADSKFEFLRHRSTFGNRAPDFERKAHFDGGGSEAEWAKIHIDRCRKEYKEYLCRELNLDGSRFALKIEKIDVGYKLTASGDSKALARIKEYEKGTYYSQAPDQIAFEHWRVVKLKKEQARDFGVSLYRWGADKDYIHLPSVGIEFISDFLKKHADSDIWYYRSPPPLLRSKNAYMAEGLVAFDKENGQFLDYHCIIVYDSNYESIKTNESNQAEQATP